MARERGPDSLKGARTLVPAARSPGLVVPAGLAVALFLSAAPVRGDVAADRLPAVQQLRQAEYGFSRRSGGIWTAPNRRQNLRLFVSDEGLQVVRREQGATGVVEKGGLPPCDPGSTCLLRLRLSGFGRGDRIEPVPPGPAAAHGRRARIRRQALGVTEWYLNDRRGIEHGFTLRSVPSPGRRDPLVLELGFPPHLLARQEGPGGGILFTSPAGDPLLRYGSPSAWDASGSLLPARVEPGSGRLRIVVEDRGARYPIIVDPLMTAPDWLAESNQADAALGWSVAAAGDVNCDGFGDVIAGAPLYDGGETEEGKIFVWYGDPNGLGASGTPGNADWSFESDVAGAHLGHAVASAGDLDGDLCDEIIAGAPYYRSEIAHTDEGRAYVFHGSATGLPAPAAPDWIAELDLGGALLGWSVASAGDVNGDGADEVLIGAPGAQNGQPGEGGTFLWLGSPGAGLGPNGSVFNIDWYAEGNQDGAQMGYAVAGAGDLNGDLLDDVIVGAPFYDTAGGDDRGWAFVWYGGIGILPGVNGNPANAQWSAESSDPGAQLGQAVALVGDVNGAGQDDVLIGAPAYNGPEVDEGAVFLWFGEAGLFGHVTSSLAHWTAQSDQPGASFGYAVAGAGDVDSDGFDDLLVGAPFFDDAANDDQGRVFLWSGGAAGPGPSGDPNNAHWTYISGQADSHTGTSVAGAGDVNADGYGDVIVGAEQITNPEVHEGRAIVFLGFSPPSFLEFGAKGDPRRVEATAASYSSIRGLVDGAYDLSGNAEVTMGGCVPAAACTRSFSFANLTALLDPNDPAPGGGPVFRVTGGSAVVDASASPIAFPDPIDLDLELYSFNLDPNGAAAEPAQEAAGVRTGLWWTLPGTLTTAGGSDIAVTAAFAIEQDLDFTASFAPDANGIQMKDYPIAIRPRVGTLYEMDRVGVELNLSDLVYGGKEQGEDTVAATGQTRCQITGACLEEANDAIFALAGASGSAWDLNRYDGVAPPAGSVGTPSVARGGLRATLVLASTADPNGRTFRPLFPAGTTLMLDPNSSFEMIDSEPGGGSLDGSLSMSIRTGTQYFEPVEAVGAGGERLLLADLVDCTGEVQGTTSFTGGQLLGEGVLHLPSVDPGGDLRELHWGGRGTADPNGDVRGFYAAGLDPNLVSFFAPGSVARVDPNGTPGSVEEFLLSKMEGGTTDEGTYAGLNVDRAPADSAATTTGVDVLCPAPASKLSGHSLAVNMSKGRLYARRAGVTGITFSGNLGSEPFDYMGYDLTLKRFGAAFLDNLPVESGTSADSLSIPSPSNVLFEFAADSAMSLRGCGDPGDGGGLENPGQEKTLAYWGADFYPDAVTFQRTGRPGSDCEPEVDPSCVGLDPNQVHYVHVGADVPLDLEPRDPNRILFEDPVDYDFAPAPAGHLVCTDIVPAGPGGSVRNNFEPGLGFAQDLVGADLLPTLNPNYPPDPDANARYEVEGDIHLPFYGAARAATEVRPHKGFVQKVFGDGDSEIPVSRSVIGGLIDLDFSIRYLPPDLNKGLPARFMSLKGGMDLRFLELPVSIKLFGAGHASGDDLGLPEMYSGYLADLASFAEALPGGGDCGAACEGILLDIADGAGSAVPPDLYDAMDAGFARLGGGDLRASIASEMSAAIGSSLPPEIARNSGRVAGFIDGVREGFQAFKTTDLSGLGTFSEIVDEPEVRDFTLDDLKLTTDIGILEFLDFKGFVEFQRHTANTADDLVGGVMEDTADVTVGAENVDLGWAIDGVRARRIQATFRFDSPEHGFRVWGLDGEIILNDLGFGEVAIDEAGLLFGMGNNPPSDPNEDYYYVAGWGRGHFKSATAEAGFFLGKSIDLEPLEMVDPDVGEFLVGRTRLTGVYARAGASFPILGGPGCFPFNLTGGGDAGFWLFAEGPTFGARMRVYAHGELLCLVSARADVTMLGGLEGDVWRLAGHGFAAGGIGDCEPGSWDSRRDVLRDSWCFACVLDGEFSTDSRSGNFSGDFRGPDCN